MKDSNMILIAAAVVLTTSVAYAADDYKGHDHSEKKEATHAHEVKAMYGGVVTEVKDVTYELVAKPNSIALYVTDHGKPVELKGAFATATLLSASSKTGAEMIPSGEKLEAKGDFKVSAGTKVAVAVKMPGRPMTNVRYTLK